MIESTTLISDLHLSFYRSGEIEIEVKENSIVIHGGKPATRDDYEAGAAFLHGLTFQDGKPILQSRAQDRSRALGKWDEHDKESE